MVLSPLQSLVTKGTPDLSLVTKGTPGPGQC